MTKLDREEAAAICGIFNIRITLFNTFYWLDHYFTLAPDTYHYDWACINELSREKLYAAVADLIKHDLTSPAHEKWELLKLGI